MEDILIPIFICVVLPVSIVAIIYWEKINSTNKRTQILMKAIEANNDINADKLAEALSKPRKSAREILNGRLLKGFIFTLVGVVCFVAVAVAAVTGFLTGVVFMLLRPYISSFIDSVTGEFSSVFRILGESADPVTVLSWIIVGMTTVLLSISSYHVALSLQKQTF